MKGASYKKTTGERILEVIGWLLIVVGAFLIFFLASGIFTALLFSIPVVIGIVMVYRAGKRVRELKKRQRE